MNFIGEINSLNQEALVLLSRGYPQKCLTRLERAERLLQQHQITDLKLKATIKNNFACYYRAIQKPSQALTQLQESLQLEQQENTKDLGSIACTHLNLGAILIDLKRYKLALAHASTAKDLFTQQKNIIHANPKSIEDGCIDDLNKQILLCDQTIATATHYCKLVVKLRSSSPNNSSRLEDYQNVSQNITSRSEWKTTAKSFSLHSPTSEKIHFPQIYDRAQPVMKLQQSVPMRSSLLNSSPYAKTIRFQKLQKPKVQRKLKLNLLIANQLSEYP